MGMGPRMTVQIMAGFMNSSTGDFPFMYLGLPIGSDMRKPSSWHLLIEKFKKKLSEWKAITMSFRGSFDVGYVGPWKLTVVLLFDVLSSVVCD